MAKAKDMLENVDNVGIMQGFLDEVDAEMMEEENAAEENSAAQMLDRRPDSPEILMNNLRGDMRSVDARREELADLVGYAAATETPDSVLAMLQPVLAQQGGLGGLPQSMPMAQGPQAPMLPPPPGGAMGVPPPGAPPLPAGAGAPGPGDMAALLAAAGPPAGGGAAAPPMMGPDGMPIPPEGIPPIQMNKGGEVRYFQDGSPDPDEEEGTQKTSELLYSPELVEMARMSALQSLAAQPQAVPTLQQAMEGRLPEYQRLLGPDQDATKAGFFFDLAQAGLNFAANRGPRGEKLSGSGLSRLAGAFSGLPAAMQKRVDDIDTAQRQLKLLALQAGEKDRDEIQNLNTKLAAEKRSVLTTILTADARQRAAAARGAGGARGIFGTGNWEMNVFNIPGLPERYAAGQTTPQENNLIASAMISYTEPRYNQIIDPVTQRPTGQYETLPGKRLPQFMLDAQRMREEGVPPGTPIVLERETPPTDQEPPVAAPVETIQTPAPLLTQGGAEPTEAGTAPQSDRPIDEPALLPRDVAMQAPVSLWRDRAKIAGPFATVYAGISRVPGLGDPMRDITLARSQAEFVAEDLTEAFLKSEQNSVTEQKMLQRVLKIRPAAMTDPDTYGTELIGLSTILDEILADYRKKADTRPGMVGSTLRPEQVAEAREKITLLERARKQLGLPPAVYSEAEIATLPPDVTEVLWMGTTPAKIKGR